MIIRKNIQLTGIVTVLCLTTVFSFTHTTNKENGKRERTIKEAQELSFGEKNWQIEETKHFIIFSHRGVSHIRKKLDKELKSSALQIARRIGYEDFQLYRGKGDDWDKKFKFFIYGSHESWLEAQKKFGRSERVSDE
ncbi:hypothetical protein B9J78_02960 [bacterium Unc6]|nr:hypothetical protein [bacterium Unc6]